LGKTLSSLTSDQTHVAALQGGFLTIDHQGSLSNIYWASLVAQTINNLPAMRETWIQSLGWEDPLEEGMEDSFFTC